MEFTIKVEGKGLQDIVEAIIAQTMQGAKGEYAQKACAYESTREGLMTEYNKLKSQMGCLKAGMEVMKAPVVITFTPGVDANHIQHPVKQIMYSAYLNGAYLPIISIPITYNTKVGSYQYHLKYFETGYIFKVADKLFMCRKGKENVYLIQIPKGLN